MRDKSNFKTYAEIGDIEQIQGIRTPLGPWE